VRKIILKASAWEYDPGKQLGPSGGFGAVFAGLSQCGEEVAVKKLHLSSAATGRRELIITEELADKKLYNVIPFYDSGIDAETNEYFIVMAMADKSLQDVINSGPILEVDAISILTEIAFGLQEVGDIVHRDLKPGNVLFHLGKWKLADFGIARFVENATSVNTLKGCLSPPYAAPEQWRLERATKATDVYAFGCIAYALLTGQPPFMSGDIRSHHLYDAPAKLPASTRMQQLISLCLGKTQPVRPSIESIIKQLRIISSSTVSHAGIAAAGAAIATEVAKNEAELSRKETEEDERKHLASDAINSLDFIIETMFETIERDAQISQRASKREMKLGSGTLKIEIPFRFFPKETFQTSRKNIICGALITIEQTAPYYRGRIVDPVFRTIV